MGTPVCPTELEVYSNVVSTRDVVVEIFDTNVHNLRRLIVDVFGRKARTVYFLVRVYVD